MNYDLDRDCYDDPNLYLPPHFITCFDERELPVYRQAVDVYASRHPQHNLDIDTSGTWNSKQSPALLCFDRGELTEFWRILEAIRGS
jgi:hypothetical protein